MPCASNSWPISQLTDLQPGAWHGAQNQEPCPGPNMIFTLAKWVTEDQNITQRNADTHRWFAEVSVGCLGEKLQPWRRGGPLFLESVRGLSQDSLSKPLLFSKLSITLIFSSVTHVHAENVQSIKDSVTIYVAHYISTRKQLPDSKNWFGIWTLVLGRIKSALVCFLSCFLLPRPQFLPGNWAGRFRVHGASHRCFE